MSDLDLNAVHIGDINVRGSVFVIPLDAPLPSELTGVPVPSGTLYERVAALNAEDVGEDFALVPIAGTELVVLDRAWRHFQRARKVYVLTGLPGARYDTLFTMAARQIGLPSIEWETVAVSLAERVRVKQRTSDKTPWVAGGDLTGEGADEPSGFKAPKASLPVPTEEDSDGYPT